MSGLRLGRAGRKAAGEGQVCVDDIKAISGIYRFSITTVACTQTTSCVLSYLNALPA